jgi:hypothetical protein
MLQDDRVRLQNKNKENQQLISRLKSNLQREQNRTLVEISG